MSNLRKNLSYQTAYQILSTCVPLITAPYLSRVLGAEALGIFSFTNSNVRYFTLFALLGVAQYGMREIAHVKNKGRSVVSRTFWEIYSFQLLASIVVTITYLFFCVFAYTEYRAVAIIQVFILLSNGLDISWLYFGLEKFKITVTRNFFIKLFTTISYFLFIKKPEDLFLYTLISSVSLVISSLILWGTLKRSVDYVIVRFVDIRRHIKPNLVLFIPSIAASIYHVMDKTMLGMFSEMTEGGYYYNADKVVNIPLTVINGCCTVIMANISSLFGQGKTDEAKRLQRSVLNFGICAAAAMTFGIASVSEEFVPIFFGSGFDKCVRLINLFAIVMIFKAVSNLTRSAFLIPQRYDILYIKAVFSGGIVNLIFNTFFIYFLSLGATGATLGTLIAESVVCVVQICLLRRHDNTTVILEEIIKDTVYFAIGGGMFLGIYLLDKAFGLDGLTGLMVKISVGGLIFSGLSLLYWSISGRTPSVIIDLSKKIKVIGKGRKI